MALNSHLWYMYLFQLRKACYPTSWQWIITNFISPNLHGQNYPIEGGMFSRHCEDLRYKT